MDIAIVTGASSSLGLAISRRLIQLGFRVYGLGGDYKDCPLQNVNFKPMACDLADPVALDAACQRILEKEKGIYLVVNNAKFFGRNRFLEMDIEEMERILRINLLCPMVLIRNFARSLKELQGYIIQLGAPYSDSSAGGAAGAAASGGLKWMGEVLFHDLRDYGVKVCHLSPEPNRGRDPRTTARPGARMESAIDPEAVAQAVEQILQTPFGNVVTEMVLRPMRVREVEQEPVRRLPYPEPQPIPYTVPREYIEAEEQLDDEERQEKFDLQRERRKAHKAERVKEKVPAEKDAPAKVARTDRADKREQPERPTEGPQKTGDAPQRPGRKPRRKPRPSTSEVGFLSRNKPAAEPAAVKTEQPVEKKPEPAVNQASDKETPAAGGRVVTARKSSRKRPSRRPAKKALPGKSESRETAETRDQALPSDKGAQQPRKVARKAPRKRAAKKAVKPDETGKNSA